MRVPNFLYPVVLISLSLYPSHHCNQLREDIFSAEFIKDVNLKASTWVAGHNFPTNTTREELGFLLDLSESSVSIESQTEDNNRKSPASPNLHGPSIPESFDARKQWPECPDIGKVYDQGACPSSYAFAVAPAFSDRRCILSKGKHPESMSIEYLLSCCHACKYDDRTRVCGAGQAITAWWFLHKRGIVTGGEYGSGRGCQPVSFPPCNRVFSNKGPLCTDQTKPSLRCHTRCTNEDYSVPYNKDRHRGMIEYWVKSDVGSIQREILQNGTVTAQITTYEDFLHYKSGVYHHVKGRRFYHQHTLRLIGWGVENGTPYWLLVNSWGKTWGDQGTVKILRGQAECNLEYYVSTAVPKRDW